VRVLRDGELNDAPGAPSVVAMGVFDGLHRGHQAIIEQLVELAATYQALATVVTFDPSPAMVLAPRKAPRLISTIDQRLEALDELGVDQVRVLTFNEELARVPARDFIDRVLVLELGARCVVVGEDFHFGHGREGDVALLREVGAAKGFDVIAAPVYGENQRWSSTSVRRALNEGDIDAAERVLGHPFILRGTVVHGDQRGEELGYPTANLLVSPAQLIPAEGVYAGATRLNSIWFPAAISVGTRPQFYKNGELLVEVHAIGYDGDLYGLNLDVVFLARLREQKTFSRVRKLTAQIERDVVETRRIFEKLSTNDAQLLE
jgi:riboflavin kinase / FMN adenylyltransferase